MNGSFARLCVAARVSRDEVRLKAGLEHWAADRDILGRVTDDLPRVVPAPARWVFHVRHHFLHFGAPPANLPAVERVVRRNMVGVVVVVVVRAVAAAGVIVLVGRARVKRVLVNVAVGVLRAAQDI